MGRPRGFGFDRQLDPLLNRIDGIATKVDLIPSVLFSSFAFDDFVFVTHLSYPWAIFDAHQLSSTLKLQIIRHTHSLVMLRTPARCLAGAARAGSSRRALSSLGRIAPRPTAGSIV
jgi:hypothetical protein